MFFYVLQSMSFMQSLAIANCHHALCDAKSNEKDKNIRSHSNKPLAISQDVGCQHKMILLI